MSAEVPCTCGAHSQHRVFRFLFENPGISLKAASKELGMSYTAVKLAKFRLKPRNLKLLCPICFTESLEALTCRNCGAELDAEPLLSEVYDSQSPVHAIQPLNGLGSATNYSALHLEYGGLNIKHLAEHPADSLLERGKSELWQELKGPMFEDSIVDEASRLLAKEVSGFRARYPGLVRSKGLANQLVRNVLSLLRLRYPNRFTNESSTVILEAENA